jgi:hypothetical protein
MFLQSHNDSIKNSFFCLVVLAAQMKSRTITATSQNNDKRTLLERRIERVTIPKKFSRSFQFFKKILRAAERSEGLIGSNPTHTLREAPRFTPWKCTLVCLATQAKKPKKIGKKQKISVCLSLEPLGDCFSMIRRISVTKRHEALDLGKAMPKIGPRKPPNTKNSQKKKRCYFDGGNNW